MKSCFNLIVLDKKSSFLWKIHYLDNRVMFYLAVAVNGAHRSQLGEEESQQVLGLTMQPEKEKNR